MADVPPSEIPICGTVQGIAYGNEVVYVIYKNLPAVDIFAYRHDRLERIHRFDLKYLDCPNDIVARGEVLHISETYTQIIHRIELLIERRSTELKVASSTWFVPSSFITLSLSRRGNVFVSCFDQHKIIEYVSTGEFVREIGIDSIEPGEISVLTHAVQLPDEQHFVVTHYTQFQHRVSWIDGNTGRILKSYGMGGIGPGHGQLNFPSYISMNSDNYIGPYLVIDELNDRIIRLNGNLELISTLNFPSKTEQVAGVVETTHRHPPERPRRMFWVAELGLLFIAHEAGAYITTHKL